MPALPHNTTTALPPSTMTSSLDKYAILDYLMNSTTNRFARSTFWECLSEMPDDLFLLIDDVDHHDYGLPKFLESLSGRFSCDEQRFSCMTLAMLYIQHSTYVRTQSLETQIEVEENAKAIFQGHYGWLN